MNGSGDTITPTHHPQYFYSYKIDPWNIIVSILDKYSHI